MLSTTKQLCQDKVTFLGPKEAYDSDQDLMSPQVGYSIDMLMELAGQATAHCVHHINNTFHNGKLKKILVICGPGNNGGDGMVAARHLSHYYNLYSPSIILLKEANKQLFVSQLNICKNYQIPVEVLEEKVDLKVNPTKNIENLLSSYDLILDALFGFSFQPPVRSPSDLVLDGLKLTETPIFSVDIPSGWDVSKGNIYNTFNPKYLISLTLPKEGSREFKGKHYVGGRFVPISVVEKYQWKMPIYEGNSTFALLE